MYHNPYLHISQMSHESFWVLGIFVLYVVIQEFLITQKKYPTLGTFILMLAPFVMFGLFYVCAQWFHIRYADTPELLCIVACLPLGLIYSLRFTHVVGFIGFPWTGRLFSFVFVGLILTVFLSSLNTVLSDMFAGLRMSDTLLLFIYVVAAAIWTVFLRKYHLRSLDSRRNITTEHTPARELTHE